MGNQRKLQIANQVQYAYDEIEEGQNKRNEVKMMKFSKMNEEVDEGYYERMNDLGRESFFVGCVSGMKLNSESRIRPVVKKEDLWAIWRSTYKECVDCGTTFYLSVEEQRDCVRRGSEYPTRCRRCRAEYKIQMMRVR